MTYLPRDSAQRLLDAEQLLSETWPFGAWGGSGSVLAGGQAYAALIGVQPGRPIGNAYVYCATAGSSTTLFKLGLYSIDGTTKYASSIDQSALFSSNGKKTIPMQASWTPPGNVFACYAVVVSTASTTVPSLARGTAAGNLAVGYGGGPDPFATAGTGLTDLPATTVTWSSSNTPIGLWVALGT